MYLLLCVQVPVPIFVPTTLQGSDQIVQTIKELQNKVPSEGLASNPLPTAEGLTEDQKPGLTL